MKPLHDVLRFAEFLNAFREIERVIRVPRSDRWENDVEHSYHLAMLAWYIVTVNKLDLDITKIITYALVHDLVEVYAGDTYIYSSDAELLSSKDSREQEALGRITKEFNDAENIMTAITLYELREDKESVFIYALDKIQPLLAIYLDDGKTWKEKQVTLEMLIEAKREKVILSPEVSFYFNQIIDLFKQEQERLFGTDGSA